jgi:hypothetical protein
VGIAPHRFNPSASLCRQSARENDYALFFREIDTSLPSAAAARPIVWSKAKLYTDPKYSLTPNTPKYSDMA